VSTDETTDASRRKVLKSDQKLSEKSFLLSRQEMSTANHTGAARVFSEAVQTVWPDGLTFDSLLLLLLPDAALYMTKPEEGLSVSYPKLSCVTCVAHALHGICENSCALSKCRLVSG
jgi:hypothetical protein